MLNKHTDGKTALFLQKINTICKVSNGSNKAELQKWLFNSTIKDANTALKGVLYVRTILSTKEELNLLDFYYPSECTYNSETLSIEQPQFHNSNQPTLIVGTVGQGKSIFLRYLCFYYLCKTPSIPIFLELRKLRSSTSLFEHIRHKLKHIKLECSEKLLGYLLSSGSISLFLDGFDEIKHEQRQYWIKELESIQIKYATVKIMVTSRPNTDIHQSHVFSNYYLKPLTDRDRPLFIKKTISRKEDQTALITKLSNADNGVKKLLDTPLLMTLFISVYKSRRKLPNSYSEFFDELFSTILSRHDGLKAAYDRPTKSGFTDKELKLGLQSLAYQSRKANLRQLNDIRLNDLVTLSLNAIRFDSGKSSEFIDDINNITCLLLKDGLEYRFIHDSVQEFYSASFVREQEEAKQIFYEKYINDWHSWSAELNFLQYIDEVAYKKNFLIPSIKKICEVDDDNNILSLKLSALTDILSSTEIVIYSSNEHKKKRFLCLSSPTYTNNWASNYICKFSINKTKNSFTSKVTNFMENNFSTGANLLKIIEANEFQEVVEVDKKAGLKLFVSNAQKILNKNNLTYKLYQSLNDQDLACFRDALNSAITLVQQKKNIGGVF